MNLAVGFFDGVHLGHRRILACADAALTFRTHPTAVFAPERTPALLMDPATRRQAIAASLRGPAKPDAVVFLEFTREFAATPPEAFAAWLKQAYPHLGTIYCGPDWTFGARGAGNAELLRTLGFAVETVPFVEVAGESVSSTRIRKALTEGDLVTATACLGRPWRVVGEVVSGKGVGHELGFPTLNVRVPAELVRPRCGVYAVDTDYGRAVANWGLAPTMGDRAWTDPLLEVHLLESAPLKKPTALAVDFRAFLRPERRFASCADLRAQIAADIRLARGL